MSARGRPLLATSAVRWLAAALERRPLWLATILLGVWLIAGIAWYVLVEGFDLFDASYQVVTTISTVGFDEVRPLDRSGRAFTMVFILFGVGLLFYVATAAVEDLVVGRLVSTLRRPLARQEIQPMQDHYVICGFGRVGQAVADELAAHGEQMTVIDRDETQLAVARLRDLPAVHGDATRDVILREAQIEDATALIAVTESDAANTLTTLSARALNPSLFIIAGIQDESARQHLTAAGANRVVSLHQIAGRRIALAALQPMVTAFLDTPSSESHEEMRMLAEVLVRDEGADLEGRTISEAFDRLRTIRVLGVERNDGEFLSAPAGDVELRDGDLLLLYGDQHELEELRPLRSRGWPR